MLERPELRQLSQRIVARYHLGPLTKAEVAAYVRHRLEISGAQRQLFPAALMGRVYRLSGGVPRVINVLCDRALLGTYVQGKERVDRRTLAQAAREVFHQPQRRSLVRPLLAALVLVLFGVLAVKWYQLELGGAETARVPVALAKTAARPVAAVSGGQDCSEAAEARGAAGGSAGMAGRIKRSADSSALAYAALFRAWGADYQGGDACKQAEGLGLRCRSARGGLDELRELNRPAVLLLHDAQGREFRAMLSALGDRTADFVLGAQSRPVPLARSRRNGRGNTPCSGACRRRRTTTSAWASTGRRWRGSRGNSRWRRAARPKRARTRCLIRRCCAR